MQQHEFESRDQHVATLDRRSGYRETLRKAAVLTPVGIGFPALMVDVFDLSLSGVGFSSAQPFTIGNTYEFAMRDGRQSGSRIEIRSCRPRPDGMFDVGGQFAPA